jgi:hypothetical protein
MNLVGDSSDPNVPAVSAVHSTNGRGVAASSEQGIALEATAANDTAVFAHSDSGRGVDGRSNLAEGVHGETNSGDGVFGLCLSNEVDNAVHGQGGNNAGFFGGDAIVKAFGISAGDITAICVLGLNA